MPNLRLHVRQEEHPARIVSVLQRKVPLYKCASSSPKSDPSMKMLRSADIDFRNHSLEFILRSHFSTEILFLFPRDLS